MKRKYWYLTTVYFCPLCGSEKCYRERVYEQPKKWYRRVIDAWDYCDI